MCISQKVRKRKWVINMYTILVEDTNELTTSIRERIMCKSKLVDQLHFLANPVYKDIDMSEFTVMMEYTLPVSKTYRTEYLVRSEELYKGKLEYKLPFDTALTSEPGNIEVQLTFVDVTMNETGETLQYVRHTTPTTITITPISAWSDMIPDSVLTPLDQRLLEVIALNKQLSDIVNTIDETKADNLKFKNNILQLLSHQKEIGDSVDLTPIINPDPDDPTGESKQEIKIVEF